MKLPNALLCFPAALFLSWGCASAAPETVYTEIIPLPQEIHFSKGSYTLPASITVGYTDTEVAGAARWLSVQLSGVTEAVPAEDSRGDITLELGHTGLDKGGYILEVTRDGISVVSESYAGMVSGIATLMQAVRLSARDGSHVTLPAVEIIDAPYYGWRGIMIDVARHFFNADEVIRVLDWMALYKFNKLHWHLTDDEGWRIELDSYPALAEKGGFRTPDRNDRVILPRASEEDNASLLLPADRTVISHGDTIYGGYYTKDDIRAVVEYASRLGIDVIPEIDMPGHSMRTLLYYPELSCFGDVGWGTTFSTPVCPGNDTTVEFCMDMWREIFDLFPYDYVHIGGDEVEKDNWRKCPHCRARMEEYGLENAEQLQSWFLRRMEQFFTGNGKKMIGWDEMLDGGLSETATVLWWRPWVPDAVHRATAQGNDVILCPNEYLYFNNKQDRNTMLKIYDNPIVPDGLTDEQLSHVLGIQGNLWTEFVPTFERLQYHYFPRWLAVSELGWNSPHSKDAEAFSRRVTAHYPMLDGMRIKYRIPDLEGVYDRNVFTGTGTLHVTLPLSEITVRYTDDGSIPKADSRLYTGPVPVEEDRIFMLRTFYPDGTPGDITAAPFYKVEYMEPVEPSGTVSDGLYASLYSFRGEWARDIATSPYIGDFEIDHVTIPPEAEFPIGLIYTGYIDIPEDGIYTFYLNSDDGSVLYIHGEKTVDNDGMHSILETTGQAALRKGLHPIEVHYFDPNGGSIEMGVVDRKGTRVPMGGEWFRKVIR